MGYVTICGGKRIQLKNTVTLDPPSISLTTAAKTQTVNIITPSDGAITVLPVNQIVSTSISGKTLTLTGLMTGTINLTVNVAQSEIYGEASAVLPVQSKVAPTVAT